MNATPRTHYEEIDWLDYVQDEVDAPTKRALAAHLAGCAACRDTVASMERLSRALPAALHLVEADGEEIEAADAFARAAAAHAEARLAGRDGCREAILSAFADETPPEFSWDRDSLEEAGALCRELLRTDPLLAGRILRSALASAAAAALDAGETAPLRSSFAYVRMQEGAVEECLRLLGEVGDALEATPVPEIEQGFRHYVRASALYESSRPSDALAEIRMARALYELLEDRDRVFRCRQVEAVLVSDLGRPEEAVELYRQILGDTRLGDNRALHATLLMNYGGDLVHSGRLDEAERVYVRASAMLRATGQERLLFRVRTGLAVIAERKGRLDEALAMKVALRPDFRALGIPWEEIQHELDIAEVLLRLDRAGEASGICRALLPRIESLGFEREAAMAVAFLAEAEKEIDLGRIGRVREFLRQLEKGEDVRWSAA